MFGLSQSQKTKELVLYIAHRFASQDNYGLTLLNKSLYFIDNISYLKRGKRISDLTYIKQAFGPTPEPRQFLSIRDQMVGSGDIEVIESGFFGRIQKRFIAKRPPRIDVFLAEEIVIIDEVLSSIGDLNGSQISDLSHQFPAWKAASDREELPFFTFLLSFTTPSERDIDWAKAAIKECTQ
ncbi:DUF4065 domain-containing protein [Fulvivirgaceae bacterium PWU4]|uniref:DUF4065 domain-containing protein n=1 Tax=Chryseosolibacter histidini TaxID=2782349 RepID=A0AAP2DNA6_9BACT|nr:Panacea domain-containing protein [Chryseosolibacter histidini]MBT1698353.1 DUF4065 domain-containing protein [Chryseosolibacter histidini]